MLLVLVVKFGIVLLFVMEMVKKFVVVGFVLYVFYGVVWLIEVGIVCVLVMVCWYWLIEIWLV